MDTQNILQPLEVYQSIVQDSDMNPHQIFHAMVHYTESLLGVHTHTAMGHSHDVGIIIESMVLLFFFLMFGGIFFLFFGWWFLGIAVIICQWVFGIWYLVDLSLCLEGKQATLYTDWFIYDECKKNVP